MAEGTENQGQSLTIRDTTANPAPLGLLAFGMTTVLFNVHNAGICVLGSMIFSIGILYGGIAQIIAGIMEWKKGNSFGTTAFISYGFFWIALVGLVLMPVFGWAKAASSEELISYLLVWTLFSIVMFIITLKLSRSLQVVFLLLVVLFLLLDIGNLLHNQDIIRIAGVEGIICGLSAMYTALGQLMNEVYRKTVVKLG